MWTRFGVNGAAAALSPEQARPTLLRFASDDFMDQMLATLARDPSRIDTLIAQPETWRVPGGAAADLIERTPLPRLAQSALRANAVRQVQPRVKAVENTPDKPLKLYQPAHQRHYLVSASLVCAQPGLPERSITAGSEQVSYVVRRLLPVSTADETLDEYAFVQDAIGPRWQLVGRGEDAQRAVPGEEPLPLFPLSHKDDSGHTRTLWTGSVPVGRREDYLGTSVTRKVALSYAAGLQQAVSPPTAVAPMNTAKLARVTQFQMEVAEPLKALIRSAFKISNDLGEPITVKDPPDQSSAVSRRVKDFNLQQQQLSWLVLLDMADYFESYLPALWQVILADGVGAGQLPRDLRDIHDQFLAVVMSSDLVTGLPPTAPARSTTLTLRAALKAIHVTGLRERLEGTRLNYENATTSDTAWPGFHFVLAGLGSASMKPDGPFKALATLGAPVPTDPELVSAEPDAVPPFNTATQQMLNDARTAAQTVDRLTAAVGRALSDIGDAEAPPLPYALQLKNALGSNANDAGLFCIRFVYTRQDCGPLHPPVVSAPSEQFLLASFFDSDAPARPIRITLPADTSPAGLRKFNKNTAFVLSDMLCGQVQRAKGMGLVDLVRAVLPWPLHKDLDVPAGSCKSGSVDIGMICSLSIPIITICALILLIIIVTLLDLIFRWLPYFLICFPVPGLKGKKD
jgi:hypothetical protein